MTVYINYTEKDKAELQENIVRPNYFRLYIEEDGIHIISNIQDVYQLKKKTEDALEQRAKRNEALIESLENQIAQAKSEMLFIHEAQGVPEKVSLKDFLGYFEFTYRHYSDETIGLVDLTGANLGNIEQERYDLNEEGITGLWDRLDNYYKDYIFDELEEKLQNQHHIDTTDMTWEDMYKKDVELSGGTSRDPIIEAIFDPRQIDIEEIVKEKLQEENVRELGQEVFSYGGKHFIPERQFTSKEGDFFEINKKLRLDIELGIFDECYWQNVKSQVPYSYTDFYKASPNKECDLFRCVENGKLYVPCKHGLQEYVEEDNDERNSGKDLSISREDQTSSEKEQEDLELEL